MIEHWVHNLNPVAFNLGESIAVRYYGLAYVFGFLSGILLLKLYYNKKLSKIDPDMQLDVVLSMIIGSVVGGRLGYCFLYAFPETINNPLSIFKVWEGGMASHGGMIGIALGCYTVARSYNFSFFLLGDFLVTLTPPALFYGRIANFINGELWGNVSNVSWAVIFPQSAPSGTAVNLIPPRHPSQLYEAFFEGIILFLIIQLRLWKSDVLKTPGRLSGEYFILYGIFRIFCESFRAPDSTLILNMTRGSFYSVFLIIGGILLIIYSKISLSKKDKKR